MKGLTKIGLWVAMLLVSGLLTDTVMAQGPLRAGARVIGSNAQLRQSSRAAALQARQNTVAFAQAGRPAAVFATSNHCRQQVVAVPFAQSHCQVQQVQFAPVQLHAVPVQLQAVPVQVQAVQVQAAPVTTTTTTTTVQSSGTVQVQAAPQTIQLQTVPVYSVPVFGVPHH